MAQEIQIGGGAARAKIRNPWAVALLPFVTFGFYTFFWYYYINREMADLGRSRNVPELGDSPGKSVLAVTLGALVIVPAILSFIGTYNRIKLAQQVNGVREPINGWILLVLILVLSPAGYAYMQVELSKVWAVEAGGAPAIPAAEQQFAQPPAATAAPVDVGSPLGGAPVDQPPGGGNPA